MGLQLVRDGTERGDAPLNDIVGMLRKAADRFEQGLDPLPQTMLWVTHYDDGSISVGAFGNCPNKLEVVGMLALAQRHLTPYPGDTTRG